MFDGTLMLNPRLIGTGPSSECTVEILGELNTVVYPKTVCARSRSLD
jgi:hypothetical protein